MTPRKENIYFLSDKDNLTYSKEGEAVIKNAFPTPLNDNPSGWQNIEIAFGTNNKYWSLNRSFTIPITFVNEGADILRWLIYKGKGYEEEINLTILSRNPETNIYELEFKGKIDFTKMKDDPTFGVTVNVIEGGLLSYLNANDGVVYEIPCNKDNPDCIKVKFDGTELFDKYNFSFFDFEIDNNDINVIAVPFAFFNKEGDSVGIIYGSPTYEEMHPEIFEDAYTSNEVNDYVASSANYFFASDIATPIKIQGRFKFRKRNGDAQIFLKSSLGNGVMLYDGTPNPNSVITVTIDEEITLAAGEKYFFFAYFLEEFEILESEFSVSTTTINPVSYSYALQPLQLGRLLVQKMTGGRYTMESNFFATHNNIVAAGGEAIREFDKAVLKTSFEDYFNYYNGKKNLGAVVRNNVLWIEPKGDLYNDSDEIFDLGEVSDLTIGYAEEYLISTVRTGSPTQEYDERNGRYEFNDNVLWKLPVNNSSIKRELNLVSKWRDDSYGIEFIRGKLNNKDTTDNKGDNEVFAFNIESSSSSISTSLSISKNPQETVSGTIAFDDIIIQDGQVEDYVVPNTSKSQFTYVNSTQTVAVSAYIYGTLNGFEATFNLNVNGTPVSSQTIPDFQTNFRASVGVTLDLNTNDAITFTVDNSVNITSGGIYFLVVNVNPIPVYNLHRKTYDNITGVPTSTVYNIEEMTPKRMLLAHSNYLNGPLFQLQDQTITFQTADKNKDLSTTYNGLTITEKEDVPVSDLESPLFLPFEISFTTKVPYTFNQVLSKLNAGHIVAYYKNLPIYLLPIGDMKCKPVSNEAQEWKLLASPLNSIDTLLRLSEGSTIIQDYMDNQLIISDLNPVHFIKYDCTPTEDKIITVPATPPSGNAAIVEKVASVNWNNDGATIYASGFPVNGRGQVVARLTTPHFWVNGDVALDSITSPTANLTDSRMNVNGIWVEGMHDPGTTWQPLDEWIGFSRKITVAFTKQMYIGISGDNYVRVKVNGTEILNTYGQQGNYKQWSIYPVLFSTGENFIEVMVMNKSATTTNNPGGFGCEIYDMSFAALQAATSESDLNIVFATKDVVGETWDIGATIAYSCPEDYVLQKNDDDSYSCVKTIKGNPCTELYGTNKKYHFKGIYDDRFQNRLERYDSKAIYYQKWQTTDAINLQFVTVGYGALELQIYNCQAQQVTILSPTINQDGLQSPYFKQEFTIDLSLFDVGVYQFVIGINGVLLAISEWQQVLEDMPDTLFIEYYNTKNKTDAYFKTWRPALRVEGFMPPLIPESASTSYEDEPGDVEILNGTSYMKQRALLGDGYGLPDFMVKKLNRIHTLNRVSYEGVQYVKVNDAKLEPSEEVTGYPMMYYTIEMRESQNTMALVISDVNLNNSFTSTLTLDAEAFGGAPGVINIEID